MILRALLLLLVVSSAPALAQEPHVPASEPGIDWNEARAAALSETPAATDISPKLQEAYETYTITALRQRTAAFAWQAFASKIIFWLVVILVLSGIAFSGIQFWFGLRRGTAADTGEVNVSLEGVKVRSQFLGVVTLALSLAFFYLYLRTVYPIVEGGRTEAPSVAR